VSRSHLSLTLPSPVIELIGELIPHQDRQSSCLLIIGSGEGDCLNADHYRLHTPRHHV
jgi:hypothetical protein